MDKTGSVTSNDNYIINFLYGRIVPKLSAFADQLCMCYHVCSIIKLNKLIITKLYCVYVNVHYVYRNFTATEARLLRVAVGSYMDHLILVVDTIKRFKQLPIANHFQEP